MLEPAEIGIARLKITLDYIEPAVMRRVEVPVSILLSDLHLVIQSAMPWLNYHLYEFCVRDKRWGLPNPDFDSFGGPRVFPAKKATLAELIVETGAKSFKYTYDFGDDWGHTIKIEKMTEAETGAEYPRLLAAERRCPPEDCGGPPGYFELIEAISNPSHERHEEVLDWCGGAFDPNAADEAQIRREFSKLAKKWARKISPRPARRSVKPAKPARKVWTT